jgi:hypothetical protein
LISNVEEEDGKGHTDIFNLPTRKQFQVTADMRQAVSLFFASRLELKIDLLDCNGSDASSR